MTDLAMAAAPLPGRPRLWRWIARAWSRLGWRHVAIVVAIYGLNPILGTNGGPFFYPGTIQVELVSAFLGGACVTLFLPLVFATMVADAAFEDGVPTWLAYGTAWLVGSFAAPLIDNARGDLFGAPLAISLPFWIATLLLQYGLCLWAYAYWRLAQRTRRWLRTAQADRALSEQRLASTRLMALQARVDPALLFDTLTRVGALHAPDAVAADRMLDDLIVLLRTMLPGRSLSQSTIAREARLVDAWLQVARPSNRRGGCLRQVFDAKLEGEPIAPMIVIPFIEAATTDCFHDGQAWTLVYRIVGERLHIGLHADGRFAPHTDRPHRFASLTRRLEELYRGDATLADSHAPPELTLDLPRETPETAE